MSNDGLYYSKDTNEPAEAINGATDGVMIEQPASGGVRRQKWLFLDGLRDWLSTAFSSLSVSLLNVAGNISQSAGITSLLATTITGGLTVDPTLGITAITTIELKKPINVTGSGLFAGALNAAVDTDTSCTLGRFTVGTPFSDVMVISHPDNSNGTDFCVANTGGGSSTVNVKTGQTLFLTEANSPLATLSAIEFEVLVATSKNPSGTWTATSDKRLKENIKDVLNPIQKIIALAQCVKQYNFIKGTNNLPGKRTQFIAQDLIEKGFSGHTSESEPLNEIAGEILGWEYEDEEYFEETPVMENIKTMVPTIIDGKIVNIPKYTEVQKTELKTIEDIQHKKETIYQNKDFIVIDKNGKKVIETRSVPVEIDTNELIIVSVKKQVPVVETITKTKRIVKKRGSMQLSVEQNLTPYLFPAVSELSKKNELLQTELTELKKLLKDNGVIS